MSLFVQTVLGIIKAECKKIVCQGTRNDGRPVFSGPPEAYLDELLEVFRAEGGVRLAMTNNNAPPLPVLLVANPINNPSGSVVKCNKAFHYNYRNNKAASFLTLLAPSIDLDKGEEDTATNFGVSPLTALSTGDLSRDPFVSSLLIECLQSHQVPPSTEIQATLKFALSKRSALDGNDPEKAKQWATVRSFFDSVLPGLSPLERLLALAGLPCCEDQYRVGTSKHRSMPERIGKHLAGFTTLKQAHDSLKDSAPPPILPALDAFFDHLASQVRVASEYEECPCHYYAASGSVAVSADGWWKTLTLEIWELLLGPADDPEQLQIRPADYLATGVQPAGTVWSRWPTFSIEPTSGPVSVFRGTGKSRTLLATITPTSSPTRWSDQDPPRHNRPIQYEFEADDSEPTRLKGIALAAHDVGLVATCRDSTKSSLPKRDQASITCELHLKHGGKQRFDIFIDAARYGVEDSAQPLDIEMEVGEGLPVQVAKTSPEHCAFSGEVDESCSYRLGLVALQAGLPSTLEIQITAEDGDHVGVASEFDRLVQENRRTSKGAGPNGKVELEKNRLYTLQKWTLEDDEGCLPTILGTDFVEAWKKPRWNERGLISRANFAHDIRLLRSLDQVPATLLAVWKTVRPSLQDLEVIEKGDLALTYADSQKRQLLEAYISAYLAWLQQDPATAAWFHATALCRVKNGAAELEPEAILLGPSHPLRLWWQCFAQHALSEALELNRPCPAAAVINPNQVPDIMGLSIAMPGGSTKPLGFLAAATSSKYWQLLWNGQRLDWLSSGETIELLKDGLGLDVHGINQGLTRSQIQRAVDDAAIIHSARTNLSVRVVSAMRSASDAGQGIAAWAEENLGAHKDPWFGAGGTVLSVHDNRHPSEHPASEEVANMREASGERVLWFRDTSGAGSCDVAIVSQVGQQSQALTTQGINSPTAAGALCRTRVRWRLEGVTNSEFLGESRRGSHGPIPSAPLHASLVSSCLSILESQTSLDAFIFSPASAQIQEQLKNSSYCAVSSSLVDPASFFDSTGKSYLWDYELPPFSIGLSASPGYYLLAAGSPALTDAVKTALTSLFPGASFTDPFIADLLRATSSRGIPTLKRLTAGGTGGRGEIAMLAALNLLLREGPASRSARGMLREREGQLAIIIPVDPFKPHLDELRAALKLEKSRPDFLVCCISHRQGAVSGLRFTAVEVKNRCDQMPSEERREALGQCEALTSFFTTLREQGQKSILWNTCAQHLIADLLSFGFRVAGRSLGGDAAKQLAAIHSSATCFVYEHFDLLDFNPAGRLVIIGGVDQPDTIDRDQDGNPSTLCIPLDESLHILRGEETDFLQKVDTVLGSWGFFGSASPVSGPPLPPAPSGPPPPAPPEPQPKPPKPTTGSPAPPPIPGKPVSGETAARSPTSGEPTPPSHDGLKIEVGTAKTQFSSAPYYFWPSNTELNQLNIGIVGDLGVGKTQLVKALIYQLSNGAKANRGTAPKFLILDYKYDYKNDDFVKAANARVLKPSHVPLNILALPSTPDPDGPSPWIKRYKFLFDVISKIYPGVGPVQKQKLRDAAESAYQAAALRGKKAPMLQDLVTAYKNLAPTADSVSAILSDFLDMQIFTKKEEDVLPFEDLFKQSLVVSLGALEADSKTKNMIVVVMLNLFFEYMLRREKQPYIGQSPKLRFVDSFLLVDEANYIMSYEFEVLEQVLLQGREFGCGVLLASQYLSHYNTKSTDYCQPLLTWFIHKVPNVTAQELARVGLVNVTDDMIQRIRGLPNHHCLYKTVGVDGRFMWGTPFFELLAKQSP
jgi:hypothetical protein